MDLDAAAEALAEANSGEVAPPAPVVSEQAPAPVASDASTVEAGTNPEASVESFTQIDLSSLDPAVRAVVEETQRNLQADYTRKMQEIAPLRKLGVDPAEAAQAVELMTRLQDPAQQRELYARLHEAFGGSDADAFGEPDDFEDGSDPRDQQIQQLASRLEQFETNMARREAQAELDRMEAVVRSENPDWKDEDIRNVEKFALVHGGDLIKGAEEYKALQQHVLSAHLARKAQVPAGGSAPASGHAEVPVEAPTSLEDAYKAGLQMLAAEQAN